MNKILIVDDDKMQRLVFGEILKDEGFHILEAAGGREAVEACRAEAPDAVLLDLKMPGMDGVETMKEIMNINPDIPVIILTGYADIEAAVETIKLGAYDFILKTTSSDRLLFTLKRAVDKLNLSREIAKLDADVEASLGTALGKSRAIRETIKNIRKISQSDISVIIQGETGSGKTVIANIIHNLGKRAGKPFVKVDIGSIPETLVESELFGHVKGSFTGAISNKKGFFQAADGGTIFIDELQNMSPYIQNKLLSVVEEKRFYPLGSTGAVEIDVRIIAATNADINEAVSSKRFREDLFFRLSEFVVNVPPLRERAEDILLFAQGFMREAAADLNRQICEIDEDAASLLKSYPWPGNIRELKNTIRRAVLFCDGAFLRREHLNFLIEDKDKDKDNMLPLKDITAMTVRDVESRIIRQVLERTKGNKSRAASVLQIDYKTLLTKVREYGL